MTSLVSFPSFDENDCLNVIIETPRGSRLKYDYIPTSGIFKPKRALPLGVRFPYDFGFVPSTRADDGDPVDVLVLHDDPSFPGALMICNLIGVIDISQKTEDGRIDNPRLIACPVWHDAASLNDVTERTREELEQFFKTSTFDTGKKVKIAGWLDGDHARKIVRRHQHDWATKS